MTLPDTSDRRVGIVLLVLALLVLCWVLFDLWKRVSALADAGAGSAAVQAVAPPPPPTYQVNQIVNAHIFGVKKKEAPKAVAQKPVQKKVEKTRLRLKLIGMVESSNENIARALIALENGKPQSYAIGDPIDRTDAKVHSVDDGKVIIDRDGRLESLEMVRPSLADEQEKQDRRNGTGSNRIASRSTGSSAGFAASPRAARSPQPVNQPINQPMNQPVNPNFDETLDAPVDEIYDPNQQQAQPGAAQAVQRVRPVRRVQRAPAQPGQPPRRAPNPKFPF